MKKWPSGYVSTKKDATRTGTPWKTPLAVPTILRTHAGSYAAVLLDCVTVWLGNMQYNGYSNEQIFENVQDLAQAIDEAPCPVAVVSNEVGWGIVPESSLGRAFRDLAGKCNQILASRMTSAVLVASGLPLVLKGNVLFPPEYAGDQS